ncbi:T9SS type A sorting domain-containing protein [uncultured Hymenobacter sp.]|uniref:T9SS type A sorting domain-containing protein n=1 Tax=uncultured Hymenobacter sp. TaxID=170016 RepID=UPI0035CB67C2
MKYLYRLLFICVGLNWLPSQAQSWRPFRPNGDVHAFRGASTDTILTLRLDSAGTQGADSVYYFNRTMRRTNGIAWQKSRNNQFGKLMRYNAAQRTYTLFWDGGPTPILTLDLALVLKPFARIGDTWTSACTDVGYRTTLVARGTAMVDGMLDSVATFQLGNAPANVQVVLSKNFGLVSAPADLRFCSGRPRMLTLARRPAPAGLSYYNPLTLLDLQPGDEVGYYQEPTAFSTFPCYTGWLLQRVLSRRVTADSVVYTVQQQSQTTYSNAPSCPGTGSFITPIATIRTAASRRTGRWIRSSGVNSVALPLGADLLAYEYRAETTPQNTLLMGHAVVANRAGNTCGGSAFLRQERLYRSGSSSSYMYSPGIDALGWQQLLGVNVGVIAQYEYNLVYVRRTVNGTVQTCGNRANFALLLPTKTAQRAAAVQLYPNPATATVTLTLPVPARTRVDVQLLDALGCVVQSQQLQVGQTTIELPLLGLTAGMYLVKVQALGAAPQHLRLQHGE